MKKNPISAQNYTQNSRPRPDWTKTKALLSKLINEYNAGKSRKEQIAICWNLIEAIYIDYIKKFKDGKAPNSSFAATHSYFTDPIKRSERTVFRQMKKLLGTPFLLAKEKTMALFKGKNCKINCTQLYLNPEIVQFHFPQIGKSMSLVAFAGYSSTESVEKSVDNVVDRLIAKFKIPPKT